MIIGRGKKYNERRAGSYKFRNIVDQELGGTNLYRIKSDEGACRLSGKSAYATHSLRRTKATLIYRKTGNLRAAQLLLGHSKIDSTIRYLSVEVEDALTLAESIEV